MTSRRLVAEHGLDSPWSYLQVSRKSASSNYRGLLDEHVALLCARLRPEDDLVSVWNSLCCAVNDDGAVSLTQLLPAATFKAAQSAYDVEMETHGSRGSIHSYLNVARADSLLRVREVWHMFAHPLLLALVSWRLGAAVRLVDLRGKDTEPLDVVARDNTLHLDNSPFMDEVKLLVSWTRGTATGPSGQGFTYLPRTHHLYRSSFATPNGDVMSDEDGCIFATGRQVNLALSSQIEGDEGYGVRVVSLTNLDHPCHTVFPASRLIHHRYRTSDGPPRSALIASFHRIDDRSSYAGPRLEGEANFDSLLDPASEQDFLDALVSHGDWLVEGLDRIRRGHTTLVDTRAHELIGPTLTEWYTRQCAGANLSDLASSALANLGETSPSERAATRLRYDLQGPLNMPLFADMREEERKPARIAIREASADQIREVAVKHERQICDFVPKPAAVSVPRTAAQLHEYVGSSLAVLRRLKPGSSSGQGTSDVAMHLSMVRFLEDLQVSIRWLEDLTSLVTAAAFALVAAEMARSWDPHRAELRELADLIFDLYWACAALLD